MNCNQLNKHFIGYIEKSIPMDLQEQISTHLKACKSCSILFENVKATFGILDKATVPEINPFFYTRLQQKLQSKHQTESKIEARLSWKLHPLAATVLIVVSVGMGVLLGNSVSTADISIASPNRSEILEAYATDYNLAITSEESVTVLMNNE